MYKEIIEQNIDKQSRMIFQSYSIIHITKQLLITVSITNNIRILFLHLLVVNSM